MTYNCNFDSLINNPARLMSNESMPEEMNWYNTSVVSRNTSLHLEMELESSESLAINMKQRVINNASEYCQLSEFGIYKAIDAITGRQMGAS